MCNSLCESFEHAKLRIEIHFDQDPSNPRKEFEHFGRMVCWHRKYNLGDDHNFDDSDGMLIGMFNDCTPTSEQVRAIALEIVRCDAQEYRGSMAGLTRQERAEALDDFVVNWLSDSSHVPQEVLEAISKVVNDHYVILPLYLYDHSGITMRTGPFGDPWDSGQVGYIYVSHKEVCENWSVKDVNDPVEYPHDGSTKPAYQRAIDSLNGEVEEYDAYLTGQVFGYIIKDLDGEDLGDMGDSCWGYYGESYCKEEAKLAAEGIRNRLDEQDAFLDTCSYDI